MKQFTGDKYAKKPASVATGLSECEALDNGELRGSGQGQRPTRRDETVKSDRGSFTTE